MELFRQYWAKESPVKEESQRVRNIHGVSVDLESATPVLSESEEDEEEDRHGESSEILQTIMSSPKKLPADEPIKTVIEELGAEIKNLKDELKTQRDIATNITVESLMYSTIFILENPIESSIFYKANKTIEEVNLLLNTSSSSSPISQINNSIQSINFIIDEFKTSDSISNIVSIIKQVDNILNNVEKIRIL